MNWKEIIEAEDPFKAACQKLGIPEELPIYPEGLPENIKLKSITEYKMGIIRDAIVGKMLNYSDSTRKWFPVIEFVPGSGWRFDFSDFFFTRSNARSRLDFETEEQSDAFGKRFINDLAILKG